MKGALTYPLAVAALVLSSTLGASAGFYFVVGDIDYQGRAGCFFLLAATGAVLWGQPARRTWSPRDPLTLALVFYLALALISPLWSLDPALSLRRLAAAALATGAAFCYARAFSGEQLETLAWSSGALSVLLALGWELGLGAFTPWQFGYRFSGGQHPSLEGATCAVLVLGGFSAACRRPRMVVWLCLALGVLALLLTKARTSIAACIIGIVVVGFARGGRRTRTGVFALSLFLAASQLPGLIVFSSGSATAAGQGPATAISQLLTRKDPGQLSSFNGRSRIWGALAPDMRNRALLGYGYDVYWPVMGNERVKARIGWGPESAHSGPLESVLNVGLLGTALLGLAVFGSYWRLVRAKSPFLLGLMVLGLVSSPLEIIYLKPVNQGAFLFWCALFAGLAQPLDETSPEAVQVIENSLVTEKPDGPLPPGCLKSGQGFRFALQHLQCAGQSFHISARYQQPVESV